jgi:hypothetical protein
LGFRIADSPPTVNTTWGDEVVIIMCAAAGGRSGRGLFGGVSMSDEHWPRDWKIGGFQKDDDWDSPEVMPSVQADPMRELMPQVIRELIVRGNGPYGWKVVLWACSWRKCKAPGYGRELIVWFRNGAVLLFVEDEGEDEGPRPWKWHIGTPDGPCRWEFKTAGVTFELDGAYKPISK